MPGTCVLRFLAEIGVAIARTCEQKRVTFQGAVNIYIYVHVSGGGGVDTSTFISQCENLNIPRGRKVSSTQESIVSVAGKFSVCMGHAPMVEVTKINWLM